MRQPDVVVASSFRHSDQLVRYPSYAPGRLQPDFHPALRPSVATSGPIYGFNIGRSA